MRNPDAITSDQYRRAARRMRARFAHRPADLQRALGALSKTYDSGWKKQTKPTPVRQVVTVRTLPRVEVEPNSGHLLNDVETIFAKNVRDAVHDRVLRYSQRQALLKLADRLKIERFRANLIIAMAQHEVVHANGSFEVQSSKPIWLMVGAALVAEVVAILVAHFLI